jgi:hypothetical protein
MKHKKFSKDNKIDVARMSRDDREQLMANLTIAELENKGKIDNYPLYYLLSRISKSNVFLDELFPEQLFSDRELFSDAKSFLSEVFVGQNGSFSPTKAKLFLSKPGLFSDLQLFSDELFSDELFLSQDLFLDKLFSDKSDAFLAQCCRLILDSGAGLHLSPSITATNFDNQIMVSGFNGSTAPTRGSGALSCVFQDANNGQNFTFTLDNVNKFDGDRTLISFGLLIKNGFTFEAHSETDLWLYTPRKEHAIRVVIGSDNIMYLPYNMAANNGNSACNYANKHTMKQATYRLFHSIFNHSNKLCVLKTLLHTNGVKVSRKELDDCFCETCAMAKARRRGLKKRSPSYLVEGRATQHRAERPYCPMGGVCCVGTPEQPSVSPRLARVGIGKCQHRRKTWFASDRNNESSNGFTMVDDDVTLGYDELLELLGVPQCNVLHPGGGSPDDALDVDDDDIDPSYLGIGDLDDYEADVPGAVLPVAPPTHTDLHRYDVSKLRPWEVMYVDNKNYPCVVRGGKLVSFVLVDLKSFAIFKVDLRSKAHNGFALRKILSSHGVHKLPYKCTVYADNCGSMVHVMNTCISMGLNFQPLPPKDQSLNLAEKAIHIIFYAACCHLLESKRDPKYFPQAVDYACYSHLRTATTASRGFITPFEAISNEVPGVQHMRPFGVICYPVIDKSERAHNAGTTLLKQPATKGIFLCYQDIWNNVYKVIIDEAKGTAMCSRHVIFNMESADYTPLVTSSNDALHENSGLIDLLQLPSGDVLEEAHDDAAPAEAEEANSDVSPSPAASTHDPISPPQQNLPSQNDSLEPESIQQPQLPNDVDSPVSSFHFPPNMPNNGPEQQNIQQQDSPKDAELLPPQNISASENDSQPPNATEVQLEINPAFDGVRRSTRERTIADHPDTQYFRTVQKEKEKHINYCRQLELQRQANSACLSNSQQANYDTCVQAENTYLAFEEAQHQDMLLSANLEKLCCYTESMDTFHCLMASLGEKPHTAHMNVAHVLAVKATKDTPWSTLIKRHPERAPEAIAKELASLENFGET